MIRMGRIFRNRHPSESWVCCAAEKSEDTVAVTAALNEKQAQYVKRQKKTVFYASVIVRSNEELAEKLLRRAGIIFE